MYNQGMQGPDIIGLGMMRLEKLSCSVAVTSGASNVVALSLKFDEHEYM